MNEEERKLIEYLKSTTKPGDKRIQMTAHMGRVWIGCEHGRPADVPHLCFDCFKAAIEDAMDRVKQVAVGEEVPR